MHSSDDLRFLNLLQKWQDGDFTRRDEQELQLLTQQDDFRREAWEGFQTHPEADHSVRLAALRARLQPGKAVRRVLWPQMTAVAAALVLILAGLWFFRDTDDPQREEVIAQNETPVMDNQTISDAAPSLQPAPAVADNMKTGAATRPAQPAPTVMDRMSKAETEAEAKADQGNNVASTAQAPSGPPVVSAPPKEAADENVADLAVEEDVVRKEQQSYSETSEKAKKATTPSAKPGAPATRAQDGQANAMQEVDFPRVALEDYLRRNARLPEAARQNNVSGFVRVSFRLRKNDKPTDFKIIGSLGYGCDEEAIRLLKEYPNWRDFTTDNLTVLVPFVR